MCGRYYVNENTVHDRMPLILEADEILTWLTDDTRMGALMQKVP